MTLALQLTVDEMKAERDRLDVAINALEQYLGVPALPQAGDWPQKCPQCPKMIGNAAGMKMHLKRGH